MLWRLVGCLSTLLVFAAAPGCNCSHAITESTFTANVGDNTVNCACNIYAKGGHVFPNKFKLCLPPELNLPVATATNNGAAPGIADMGDAEFARRVNEYCTNEVEKIVYHVERVVNGGWCDAKVSGDMGIGNPIPDPDMGQQRSVVCFAEPLDGKSGDPATYLDNTPDAGCNMPCGDVACASYADPNVPQTDTCDSTVQVCDFTTETCTIDPSKCKCNQVVNPIFNCPGDSPEEQVPTPTFCQPGPGRTDPSGFLPASLLTYLVSMPIPIDVDPTQSSTTVSITELGDTTTRTSPVHGSITMYGRPCPGAECDMIFDFSLFPEDFTGDNHFHYSVAPDIYLSKLSILGGMGQFRAHIFSDGTGVIPIGQLLLDGEGNSVVDGALDHSKEHLSLISSNPQDIHFSIDWSHNGSFVMPSTPLSGGDSTNGGSGTLTVVGRIGNLPPSAKAGSDQSVECTSPAGADVTLDGSNSSDPDGDPLSFTWWQGPAMGKDVVGKKASVVVTAPIGTTQYSLSITDYRSVSFGSMKVTVTDTTPPSLSCPADLALECVDGAAIGNFSVNATDRCASITNLSCSPPSGSSFQLGTTQDTCTATDSRNLTSNCSFNVDVRDTIPPVATVKADSSGFCATLWAPDHRYASFSLTDCVTSVIDQCDGPLSVAKVGRVLRITSDELDNGGGSGDMCNDAVISSRTAFQLRMERDGTGDGRVYTVIFGVSDHAGNEGIGSFKIQVPHDVPGSPALDTGAAYCVGQGCGVIPGSNCP